MASLLEDESNARKWRWGFLAVLFGACLWAGRHGGGGDFFVLRNSVIAAWNGVYSKVYLRDAPGPFFYPPFALFFFGLFSLVTNEHIAIALNLVFHSLSFLGFWWGLSRLFPYLFTAKALGLWFFCFCFSIAPIHLDFMGQNINLPLATMLILVEVLRQKKDRKSDFLCGFCSSLIVWIKIFPGFVTVTYGLKGSRELRWGIFSGGLVGLLMPLVVFFRGGVQLYQEFFKTLIIYHEKNLIDGSAVLNLPGLVARWGVIFFGKPVVSALTGIIPIACASLFWGWLVLKTKKSHAPGDLLSWSMAMGLMTFLNSASRPDYFMFYVPIFSTLLSDWKNLIKPERVLLGLAFVFIALTQQAIVGRDWNIELQYLRVPVVGMALLFFAQLSVFFRQGKYLY